MTGSRIVFKSLVLLAILVLFVLPLTVLRRAPGEEPAPPPDSAGRATAVIGAAAVVAGWTATALETFYPDAEAGPDRPPLSDKVDGGDVLFYEYGFRLLFARELERLDGSRLYLEEYLMSDPAAAYGIWSANRDSSNRILEVPVLAAGGEDRAVLCHGARYLSVTADGLSGPAALEEFVAALGQVLFETDPAARPVEFPLPDVPRIAGTEKLIRGPVGGQSAAVPVEVLGVSRVAPGYQFSVPAGDSFVPAVAVRDSEAVWNSVAAHFGVAAGSGDAYPAGNGDERSFVARLGGFIVVGSMIASDAELADFRKALNR